MKTIEQKAEEMAREICQKINSTRPENLENKPLYYKQAILETLIQELEKRV